MYWTRWTTWHDDEDTCRRIACAQIDAETREVLSEAVEHIGPFQTIEEATEIVWRASIALRDGQYRGQQALDIDGSPITAGIACSRSR